MQKTVFCVCVVVIPRRELGDNLLSKLKCLQIIDAYTHRDGSVSRKNSNFAAAITR